MRVELLYLVEKFGIEYSRLLNQADDTGDFKPLDLAEETFADSILTLLKERVEKALLTPLEIWNADDGRFGVAQAQLTKVQEVLK